MGRNAGKQSQSSRTKDKRKRSFRYWCLLALLIVLFLQVPGSSARSDDYDEVKRRVAGQVLNSIGRPAKHVKVNLWTKSGELSLSTRTDGDGKFSFIHDPCMKKCYLEVLPSQKSGLASAIIENIDGNDDRTVIVNLKRGFLLSGRVVSEDEKGLKGVLVKVFSEEHAVDVGARVHGGGAVRTNRGGHFSMVLTPGKKHLVVWNNRFSDLEKRYDARFLVTSDMELQDVVLSHK